MRSSRPQIPAGEVDVEYSLVIPVYEDGLVEARFEKVRSTLSDIVTLVLDW